MLVDCLSSPDLLICLNAVLALEKLAATRANKERILKAGVAEILVRIEDRLCTAEGAAAAAPRPPEGEALTEMGVADELLRAQVGFCAMWALDNVLPAPGRQFTVEVCVSLFVFALRFESGFTRQ
jgi:hypothetical protein